MRVSTVRHMALVKDCPESVLQQLTFTTKNPVTDEVTEFKGYEVDGDGVWIPRAYMSDWLTRIEDANWERVEIPFNGKLRPEQQLLADKFLNGIRNGIISAGTGTGKTIIGLYIAHRLGLKTLVVTPTDRIYKQWIQRVHDFCGFYPSTIRAGYCDFHKPITVGMLQTLALSKKLDRSILYDKFGLVIYDEVHRIPTERFSRVAKMFWDKYRLGLSATVRRKDGLHNLFIYHIGNVITYTIRPSVIPRVLVIKYHDVSMPSVPMYNGKPNMARYLNRIAKHTPRNITIALHVESAYRKERHVLVLSDRLSMLDSISYYLRRLQVPHGWITGQRKEVGKRVLLGTYGAAGEGLDIPELDVLVLASPRADIRQALGRILRPKNRIPIVIDYMDVHSEFLRKLFYSRNRTYTAMKCSIQEKYVNGDEMKYVFQKKLQGRSGA